MTHVYDVYFSSCRYEGGGTEAIFSTPEAARAYALARVEEEKLKRAYMNRMTLLRHPDRDLANDAEWVEEQIDRWGDGMSMIAVYTRLINDPEPMLAIAVRLQQQAESEARIVANHQKRTS